MKLTELTFTWPGVDPANIYNGPHEVNTCDLTTGLGVDHVQTRALVAALVEGAAADTMTKWSGSWQFSRFSSARIS